MTKENLYSIVQTAGTLLQKNPDKFVAREVDVNHAELIAEGDTPQSTVQLSVQAYRGISEERGPYLESNVLVKDTDKKTGIVSQHRTTISTLEPSGYIGGSGNYSTERLIAGDTVYLDDMTEETTMPDGSALQILQQVKNLRRSSDPRHAQLPSYQEVKDRAEKQGCALGDIGRFF